MDADPTEQSSSNGNKKIKSNFEEIENMSRFFTH